MSSQAAKTTDSIAHEEGRDSVQHADTRLTVNPGNVPPTHDPVAHGASVSGSSFFMCDKVGREQPSAS